VSVLGKLNVGLDGAAGRALPAAMVCLERDLDKCLCPPRFPFVHRCQIRTANLLERFLGESRRGSKVIPRLTSEAGGPSLLFAVLLDAYEGWHSVRMRVTIAVGSNSLPSVPTAGGMTRTWRDWSPERSRAPGSAAYHLEQN
jgi:transposase-like protein